MLRFLWAAPLLSAAMAAHAASADTAPPQDPPPSLATPQANWDLRAGVPVHEQLATWATQAGWQFSWQPRVSWRVAAPSRFEGSFEEAIQQVIQGLFFEGKPVRLVLWEGNHVAEVVSHDVR